MSSSHSHPEDAPAESGSLQAIVHATLRGALDARRGGASGEGELRQAVRALADHARRNDLSAERLAAVIQDAWKAFPETRSLRPQSTDAEMAAGLLGACIDEVYAAAYADGEPGAGAEE